jgi:gas vesicle protein
MARTSEFSGSRPSGTASHSRESDLDSLDSTNAMTSGRSNRRSYSEDVQWRNASIFGAGVALGALLGAGAALLFAPQTGEETREMLSERAHRFGGRIGERIDDARGDLGWYMRRGRRKLRRGAERGRWTGEDIADRIRRGW